VGRAKGQRVRESDAEAMECGRAEGSVRDERGIDEMGGRLAAGKDRGGGGGKGGGGRGGGEGGG